MAANSENNLVSRARYVEYDEGEERIAMISDPENARAWIESDVTYPLEP